MAAKQSKNNQPIQSSKRTRQQQKQEHEAERFMQVEEPKQPNIKANVDDSVTSMVTSKQSENYQPIQSSKRTQQQQNQTHEAKRFKRVEEPKQPIIMANQCNENQSNTMSIVQSNKTVKSKKPQPKAVRSRKSQLSLAMPPDLSQYAICWVKIRGYKNWPGVIEDCKNGLYTIHFFGDYTIAKVHKTKITNFYEGFSLFQHTFDAPALHKAVQEACIGLMSDASPSKCLVCDILSSKRGRALANK